MQDRHRLDTLHDCLKHSHRRRVLHCLERAERPHSLATLAEYVAERETDGDPADGDRNAVTVVRRELYHRHLPKLAAAELVEWDREEDVVVLAEYPEELIDELAPADG